ncbi:MAG TPA: amidohydrolase family protein [Steroidobacteraceae bacterium]|nr:amidohydrolase family protein [Steroidobacteraceae bacterium]
MTGRVDSHQHFWRLDRGDYGWLTPDFAPVYRDYLPGDLAPHLAAAGVDSTVLVQAAPTLAETRFLLDLAARHENVAAVVGWVDFESELAPYTIAGLAENEKLVGLRPMIQDIPDTLWMLNPALAPAIETMIDHDLVFDALVLPRHLEALGEFATLYPELRIVVDHGAKPPLRGESLESWKAGIGAIAKSTRAVCKLSGLVTEAGSAEPARLAPCVGHLLEVFGPARVMWGSDWPVCELVCSYEDWCRTSETLLANLSDNERQRIYAETARETYGI